MIVVITILLAFVLNLTFMFLESRDEVWKQGKFWIMLISLGIVLGTVIYGTYGSF